MMHEVHQFAPAHFIVNELFRKCGICGQGPGGPIHEVNGDAVARDIARAQRDLLTDKATCTRIIASGTVAELLKLRSDLVAKKNNIDTQLSGDRADQSDEVAELIAEGVSPDEAETRAAYSGDPLWRHRATSAGRSVEVWLTKIKARLAELQPGQTAGWKAIATSHAGVAKSAEAVTAMLNEMICNGAKIVSFGKIGDDLVVISSRPAMVVAGTAGTDRKAST